MIFYNNCKVIYRTQQANKNSMVACAKTYEKTLQAFLAL